MAPGPQRSSRPLKKLDDTIPPLTEALTRDIRTAHDRAGKPSLDELRQRIFHAGGGYVGIATLSRILTPNPASPGRLPSWNYYELLLGVLGENPPEYHGRWDTAQREWRVRKTPDAAVATPPPAPVAVPHAASRFRDSGAYAVTLAVSAVAVVGYLAFRGLSAPAMPARAAPAVAFAAAPLVTGAPPRTVPGVIARTWNESARASIGVKVFPSPYVSDGWQNGPRHDGESVNVVCHKLDGRHVHESLDTGRADSAGWYRIFYDNRLWFVSDHYIDFPPGASTGIPGCAYP